MSDVKINLSYDVVARLITAFPGSFVIRGEFIAHRDSNQYFILHNCENELDVKCKVLEWLSRAAYKTQFYNSDFRNEEFHQFMLKGINTFLGTEFDKYEISIIYQLLGNCVRHDLTVRFVESGYDIDRVLVPELIK